ncbi:hypothetical protein ABZ235_29500 [Streptomyces canus]|uniref:tetratricopeptide repeat protein n=1 Tax=Streptomyces canus TaxID=58343 RepID=UPI0033B24536
MRYVYRRKGAQFLERLGEPKRAAAVWRELADQGNTDAFVHVGRHCLTMGQHTEAERWFRQGAKAGDDDAMQALVFLLAEDGLLDEAAEWTERIARPAHSGDIYAYSRLAYRFERAANLSQAKIYFRKAIDDGLVDCYQDLVRLRPSPRCAPRTGCAHHRHVVRTAPVGEVASGRANGITGGMAPAHQAGRAPFAANPPGSVAGACRCRPWSTSGTAPGAARTRCVC